MKVFLDANVLFSAANEASNLSRMILRLSEREQLLTSDYAEVEASRNIHIKRPVWEPGYVRLMKKVQVVSGIDKRVPVEIAIKDRPILATAISENCDILLTGDRRDFGHLFGQTIGSVTVMTPLMFTVRFLGNQ